MATFTLSNDPRFPVGTTLSVWEEIGGIPFGPVIDSAAVTSTGVTFEGLRETARYAAGVTVNGPFTRFRVPDAAAESGEGGGLGAYTKGVIKDLDGLGGIERPNATSVEWIQPLAPTIGDGADEARDGDTWIPSVVEE